MGIQITPSILNADFAALGAEVARIGSADWVHVDVMDNHFVPNLTFGPAMVEALARSTEIPLDAHLMIEDADRNALAYVEAGCGSVTFHVEAASAPVRLAREIRKAGARASMALKPATPIEPYEDLLPELDMLLIMTVEPGFGGQTFLDLCLPKIRAARAMLDKHGIETWIQVDGGISLDTIERAAEAGADVFVAGQRRLLRRRPRPHGRRSASPSRGRGVRVTAEQAEYAALAYPHPLRRHQREALDALGVARAAGRQRAWVVLPPGAGKTLVGLETIRREGRRAVVLCPNTAIQGQWVRGWRDFGNPSGANPIAVGSDRDLATAVTALTYQSLAVFDDEPDDAEGGAEVPVPRSELDRLHANGKALVRTLQEAGPITLVLDECHHLLEVWGRLLGELLELLPDATVLGLTATPATTLTPDQAVLVDQLFGDVVYSASIPAVVREGHLAPFADLIWLTTPSTTEAQWLGEQNQRFAELTTQLLDPSFGSVPFLAWVDRRFAGEARFDRIAAKQPLLADAALRMRYAGLLRLADDVPMGEQHRHAPTADDWALLIDDWYDACLVSSVDDRDQDVREALRRSLPAVGFQLTKRGMRKGRSSVDRVLARSESKSRAMVEIISAEHRNLGDRLAMLVICDHEAAAATVGIDLKGVLAERAGSARLALASLLADPTTAVLAPVMVTGKTVAAAP